MARAKGSWSEATFRATETIVKERGSSTAEGEDRVRQGKGLDPLVDPSQMGVIRMAKNLLVPDGDIFVLEFGVAMPVKTDFDTTGSMGGNVDIGFAALPKVQNLLVQGQSAVLKRYHTQIATGIVQDRIDQFPYLHTQYEPDNEVERQMGLLVPDRWGGDSIEDYQLSLFAAAYLTETDIVRYGLKGYWFIAGDEIGRTEFDLSLLKRVFGDDVLKKAGLQSLPTLKAAAKAALAKWHLFYLQVDGHAYTTKYWSDLIGEDRVIQLARMADIAETEACIIGLTEGEVDVQSIGKFLKSIAASGETIARVEKSVRGIPMGAQTKFENFDKIPTAGAKFASRDNIWPIDSAEEEPEKTGKSKPGGKKPSGDFGL